MVAASLWQKLGARGLVAQHTGEEEISALLRRGALSFYLGLDPTGDSLHVGHLTPLMLMRHLADAGHKPLVVVGGGTAMVGDPTGKSEARPMLSTQDIARNAQRIAAQVQGVLGQSASLTLVDNAEWLLGLNYVTFLREIGRHFSVNRMLAAESVKLRLESSLSFLEFNYPLLQAYDFLMLKRAHNCLLQIGGDDQWGNILAGVDLTRRADATRVEALTVPLLTTASGAKMGKTAQGAIWLAPDRLSPNDFYQYWVQTDDRDVLRFLRIYTLLPLEELESVAHVASAGAAVVDKSHAKHLLAYEVTALVHGHDAATQALAAAQAAFGVPPFPSDWVPSSKIVRGHIEATSAVPTLALEPAQLKTGLMLVDVLVTIGWAKSKNDARRLIAQGGVRLDESVVSDAQHVFLEAALVAPVTLRAGKRRVHRLTLGRR